MVRIKEKAKVYTAKELNVLFTFSTFPSIDKVDNRRNVEMNKENMMVYNNSGIMFQRNEWNIAIKDTS